MNLKTILDVIKYWFFPESEPEIEDIEFKKKQKEKSKKRRLNKYKRLLAKIKDPETREKILQDKTFKVLKINSQENLIVIRFRFNKLKFIFDRKGFKIFNEDFYVQGYKLYVINDYLGRVNEENGRVEFFHRFFLRKLDYNISHPELIVHHINFNKKDNRRSNLIIMTREEHDIVHNRITI